MKYLLFIAVLFLSGCDVPLTSFAQATEQNEGCDVDKLIIRRDYGDPSKVETHLDHLDLSSELWYYNWSSSDTWLVFVFTVQFGECGVDTVQLPK